MKTWDVEFEINGEEETEYITVETPISNKLYDMMVRAIYRGVELADYEPAWVLYEKAEKELYKIFRERVEEEETKPVRQDYYDYQEYLEAMEDYRCKLDSAGDEYTIESEEIYDPGERLRFVHRFKGRVAPQWAGQEKVELEYKRIELGCDERYNLTVHVDGDGRVTNITGISGRGLASSGWSECYDECPPDYDYIAGELEKEFEE